MRIKEAWEDLRTSGIFTTASVLGINFPWGELEDFDNSNLDNNYYAFSSNKITSPEVDDLLEEAESETLTTVAKQLLATELLLFIPHWKKHFDMLKLVYDPTSDYGYEKNETINRDIKSDKDNTGTQDFDYTQDDTIKDVGFNNNSTGITYGHSVHDEAIATDTLNHSVYAFDNASDTPSPDSKDDEHINNSKTVTESGTDFNNQKGDYADTKIYDVDDKTTRTDDLNEHIEKDDDITTHSVVKGQSGRHAIQDLLMKERNLWLYNFFYEIVFPDVDNILTCGCF